jgi:hypothetical protein
VPLVHVICRNITGGNQPFQRAEPNRHLNGVGDETPSHAGIPPKRCASRWEGDFRPTPFAAIFITRKSVVGWGLINTHAGPRARDLWMQMAKHFALRPHTTRDNGLSQVGVGLTVRFIANLLAPLFRGQGSV